MIMLNEKDSEIIAIARDGDVGVRAQSKYDRLIDKAKEVPAAKTVVVYPCDETSLRGAGFELAGRQDMEIPRCVDTGAEAVAIIRAHHASWLASQGTGSSVAGPQMAAMANPYLPLS